MGSNLSAKDMTAKSTKCGIATVKPDTEQGWYIVTMTCGAMVRVLSASSNAGYYAKEAAE